MKARSSRGTTLAPLGGGAPFPTPLFSQLHKPIRPLAPSEAEGTHGTMLVAAVGHRWPALIGQYCSTSFLEWLMGFPDGWTDVAP